MQPVHQLMPAARKSPTSNCSQPLPSMAARQTATAVQPWHLGLCNREGQHGGV